MKRKHKVSILILFIAFSLSFQGSALDGSTEENDSSRLQQKIARLEERIKHLEILLKECGGQTSEETDITGWQNKKNWRRLETGMNMEKVQSLLGKPVKTIKGVRTLWYYPNIYCGYVSFDKDGNLIAWNEP